MATTIATNTTTANSALALATTADATANTALTTAGTALALAANASAEAAAIGAETIALSPPSFLSVTGSPITLENGGTFTLGYSGTALPVANGGTGTTTSTGTGAVVLSASPTLVTPVLGAATGTSLAISGGIISATLNGAGFTTPLAALNTTGTTTLFQLGRTLNSGGNIAQFAFLYNGNNDATNEISLGFYGGGGSRLGLRNSTTTGATFNCNLTAATINSTQLTASQAVFTDASKNLVSVATTGTGSVVLATSPTLVSPALGFATAQSLSSTGNITTSGASMTVTGFTAIVNPRRTANPSYGLRIAGNEWGFATSAGFYSNNAIIGDSVLRATGQLHLQSGSGNSAISINNSNIVTIRQPLTLTSALTTANGGTGLSTVGTNGQVLTSNGTTLSWETPSAPGTGTVTSVASTVPSFLSVAVTNPTTTPSINITATSTGTGSVVLATAPTISGTATFTSTLEATPPLTVSNNASNFTIHVGDYFGPNTGVAGQVYSRHGVNATVGNRVQNSFVYTSSGSGSNYMTYAVTAGSSFRINNNNTAPFTFVNPSGPVAFGAGGISVSGGPLPTAFGGTGLSTVGTSGQYLSSNGTTLSWVNPSAGTGSVISVSLTVDPSITGLFTNTGIPTVTTTGTFTLAMAANPNLFINGTTSRIEVSKANNLNRKLVLFDANNNDHQFIGLGTVSGQARYQVAATTDAHVFYAGNFLNNIRVDKHNKPRIIPYKWYWRIHFKWNLISYRRTHSNNFECYIFISYRINNHNRFYNSNRNNKSSVRVASSRKRVGMRDIGRSLFK